MDVSIIIVNWNTRQLLADCIRSVYQHAGDADYEIIVVDNASSDGSAEMMRHDFGEVKLIANADNLGFAAANNQAMREAKGRYILLLNSDTIVCDGAISKMKEYADLHPEGAVFGCQVRENSTKIQQTCFRYPSILNMILRNAGLAKAFKYNHFFGREMMLWWKRDTPREVDVISGMFMFVRREAIEKVGMMDESYFLYFEETDWCRRFSKAGWKLLFWPGAKIIHLDGGNKSTDQQAAKMRMQYQKSMLLFFRKNYGVLSSCAARLLLALDSANKCMIWIGVTFVKKLGGRSVRKETSELKHYWQVLRFCLSGSERHEKYCGNKIGAAKFLKEGTEFLCAALYCLFLPFTIRNPRRVVLYYHGIDKHHIKAFERQMHYLAKHCIITRAADIAKVNGNSGKVIAAITFDDAFTSVAAYAAAILKKYKLPATIFVPAGWLGRQPHWMTDNAFKSDNSEAVMEKERIAELSGNGFEFCSHSVSHVPLSRLRGAQLEEELTKSKDILESITGQTISAISYPYGEYNENVCEAARRAGYKMGFTIEPRIVDCASDSLSIGRFKVEPDYSMMKFRLKVSGAYQISIYLRRAKAMLTRKRFGETESARSVESYC